MFVVSKQCFTVDSTTIVHQSQNQQDRNHKSTQVSNLTLEWTDCLVLTDLLFFIFANHQLQIKIW